ncbi:hypothetical protein HR45_00375 [Shewanella mangrovi]|uniref:Uncharacterized protein n=1 Tax=Shewanella mangrovi TaxID=1515746 RepID=A0A094JI98_9GAMM|nr:hypothetical protein [Shewanella mangrovi]KFZ38897.1 hypothetical protein HR45_00375 [Shewanella mangrovi]
MTQASQQQIKQQLDVLAKRGEASLFAVAKASARRNATLISLCCFAPIVLLGCLVQWWQPATDVSSSVSFWCVLLLLPVSVFAGRYYLCLTGFKPSRATALALYDKQLRDDDRLQTADEFSQLSAPSPFQQAAMLESHTAITQALAAAVPQPEFTLAPFSRWSKAQLPLTALLLLLLGLQPSGLFFANASLSSVKQKTVSELSGEAAVAATPQSLQAAEQQQTKATRQTLAAQTSTDAQSSSAKDSHSANDATGSNVDASLSTEKQTASASSALSKSNGDKSNSASSQPSNAADKSEPNSDDGQDTPSSSAPKMPQQSMPLADDSERHAANAEHGAMSDSNPQQEQPASKPQTGSAQAGQQGQLAGKKQAPKSKSNQGQQQSGDQANPNSQNTGNHGDDGLKKSRGINSLMLAVPMEDQFVGTPGPGAEKRSTKQRQPDDMPANTMFSEQRGSANGALTPLPTRMMQPWEVQLLSKFYQQLHADNHNNDKTQ